MRSLLNSVQTETELTAEPSLGGREALLFTSLYYRDEVKADREESVTWFRIILRHRVGCVTLFSTKFSHRTVISSLYLHVVFGISGWGGVENKISDP